MTNYTSEGLRISTYKNGTSAYQVLLDNDSATIGTKEDGTGWSAAALKAVSTINVEAYMGNVNITDQCNFNWATSGCTLVSNGVTGVTNTHKWLTSIEDESESATVTISASLTQGETQVPIGNKTFTITKVKQGAQGKQGPKGPVGPAGTGVSVKTSRDECNEIGDSYIDTDGNLQVLTAIGDNNSKIFTNGGQIKGPKGDKGENSFLHVAYADDEDGGDFSEEPTGKSYIGTYLDNNSVSSQDPKKYTWTKWQGDDAITYILSVSPNSWNKTTSTSITPTFTVTKYEGNTPTQLTSGYVIKIGDNTYTPGTAISSTSTFDLWIDGVKVDSETVAAVQNGDNAKDLNLLTDHYFVTKKKNGGLYPPTINFTAQSSGLTGVHTWKVGGTPVSNNTGATYGLTIGAITEPFTVEVARGGLSDTITIGFLEEGSDAISIILSNPTMVFNSNDLTATETCSVLVYSGANQVPLQASDATGLNFTISTDSTGVNITDEVIKIQNPRSTATKNFKISLYNQKILLKENTLSINCTVVNDTATLNLSNDYEVVVKNRAGVYISPFPISCTAQLYVGTKAIEGLDYTWTGPGNFTLKSATINLGGTGNPKYLPGNYEVSTTHNGTTYKKTFAVTEITEQVDYSLIVPSTVNVTNGSKTIDIRVLKIGKGHSEDNEEPTTLTSVGKHPIKVQTSSDNENWDPLDSWSLVEISQTTYVRITNKDESFVWDSEIVEIVNNGDPGDSLLVIYRASSSIPGTPTTGNPPTGWSFEMPTSISDSEYVYMSQKLKSTSVWSTPIQISAKDGIGVDGSDIKYVYYKCSGPEELPSLEGCNGGSESFNGWHDSPQGVDPINQYEYVAVSTKPAGSDSTWGSFSSPVIWSKWGEKGQDGDGVLYYYCRTNSDTLPAYPAPSGAEYEWTDEPQGVSETNQYEYVVAVKSSPMLVSAKKINTAIRIFTEEDWNKYGAENHQENWTIRTDGENTNINNDHLKQDDFAYVSGYVKNSSGGADTSKPRKIYGKVIGLTNPSTEGGNIRMVSMLLVRGEEPTQNSLPKLWAKWGENGTSPYIITLNNDSATIGTDKDGKNWNSTALEKATETEVTVYQGESNITGSCTYSWSVANGSAKNSSGRTNCLTNISTTDDTATLTVSVTYNNTLIGTKTLTVTKNKQGNDAVTYILSASPNSWNNTPTQEGGNLTPTNVTFTVTKYTGNKPEKITTGYKIDNTPNCTEIMISDTTTFTLYIPNPNNTDEWIAVDSETVTAVQNGPKSTTPGPTGNTRGIEIIYKINDSATTPNTPTTIVDKWQNIVDWVTGLTTELLEEWISKDATTQEYKHKFLWKSQGTYVENAETKEKTYDNNWTTPELYDARYGKITGEKAVAFYKLFGYNADKEGIAYDDNGKAYINASYINTGTFSVTNKETNETLFSAGWDEDGEQGRVSIGGWYVDKNILSNGNSGQKYGTVGMYSGDGDTGGDNFTIQSLVNPTKESPIRFYAGLDWDKRLVSFAVAEDGSVYLNDAQIGEGVTIKGSTSGDPITIGDLVSQYNDVQNKANDYIIDANTAKSNYIAQYNSQWNEINGRVEEN